MINSIENKFSSKIDICFLSKYDTPYKISYFKIKK